MIMNTITPSSSILIVTVVVFIVVIVIGIGILVIVMLEQPMYTRLGINLVLILILSPLITTIISIMIITTTPHIHNSILQHISHGSSTTHQHPAY
jgi:uncharacterized membrane protein (UPF0182 family)